MSRFDDEQQPGPSVEPAQRESEPRLLTRREPADKTQRPRRTKPKSQHNPETGLRAWAGRLASKRAQRSPRARTAPRPRWVLWALSAAVLFACLAAVVMILDLRHAMTASLPQLDGEVRINGLHAPVTVTRDAHGVPSISATSLDDLLFAQGYITASDRLWQMDGIRRHAAGDLAEILGPGMVEHDRRQRLLMLRATADRAVAQLPPDQLAQLEAYARGVNAFIDSHRNALPVEFRLLAYKPAPWSPRDSLLVSLAMWQDLSTEFPQKLNREALSAHLPADLLPDLYPVGSWRDQPPASQDLNLSAPHEVEQIPLDPSQAAFHPRVRTAPPQQLLAVSNALGNAKDCQGCLPGSNNWAVSGTHTQSGAPLLSNDMHLALAIPDTWYEASLHAGLSSTAGPNARLDVSGFTLPGVPFVIVGRNAHVAWGLTNLTGDVQDLRVEHLRGSGNNTEYERADGSWAPANHHLELIHVRGGRDVALDVVTTTHMVGSQPMETPIISALYPSEHRNLSLAWTALDPSAINSPFLGVNTADDGASLVASFATFGGPSLNLVWADSTGHIGYHALGRIPIRGLAIQHPREAPAPTPAVGPLPPEGDDAAPTELDGPQAALTSRPHLLLSAYHPVRRRREPARTRAVPVRSRARRGRIHAAEPVQTERPTVTEASLLPTSQPRNYTVGSPISPLPVDALDASQEWSGYIGYADLPSVQDPPGGFVATANSRITPNDYPWAVANDWPDAFRSERIVHLLSGKSGLTPADMLRIQNDVHSDVDQNIAQRLAYALDHASSKGLGSDARRLHQAADLMRNWNGDVRASSPTAAIVRSARDVLWPSLLIPQIIAHDGKGMGAQQALAITKLYTWNEETTALDLLLQNQPARWLPRGFASWNDFLATVTERGLQAGHAPADLSKWQYGQLHTIEIEHPVFGDHDVLSRLLAITGTTGAQPAPGDGTTIKQMGAHFGPSERFTADLSSPDAAYANITTGQSGDPHSPWYLDQFRAWLAGTTFTLPSSTADQAHTLTLMPQ